ncbi:MAG: TonB-dependent receptor plug domain-containing protein [Draconibacterium sp.]|nr:TonB-dependent receptor plug domain-containing protein [Draconibacterium sp.]
MIFFVGMKSQEVTIGNQAAIDITLESENIGLDEVIAVGYATQKKANIVGSVTSVNGEKIASIPSADVTNALSGRMPGSVVIQGSGEPGQNEAKILVRGRTTLGNRNDHPELTAPLVIIDGIPGRSLGDIDPVDIESISVLKDASAAIYGASAANGVILVTTKNSPKQLMQVIMLPCLVSIRITKIGTVPILMKILHCFIAAGIHGNTQTATGWETWFQNGTLQANITSLLMVALLLPQLLKVVPMTKQNISTSLLLGPPLLLQ